MTAILERGLAFTGQGANAKPLEWSGLVHFTWGAIVAITLRVMKFHHAERDDYDKIPPLVDQLFL